jgi:hypothetical protein
MSDNSLSRGLGFGIPLGLILWALLIWAILSITAGAAELPVSTVSAEAAAYDTPSQAATAALGYAVDISDTIEMAGGIIERDHKFYFTNPVPGNETRFELRLKFLGKLVAIYHTHPGHHSDVFSPEDVTTAQALAVPSYIRVVETNVVYKMSPGGTGTMLTGGNSCHGMTCAEYYQRRERAVLAAYGQ